jgi:RHS repeat-associated protein
MSRCFRRYATLGLALLLWFAVPARAQQVFGPVLTVERDYFQVNGEPTFLLFVSFPDGVREATASPTRLESDLNYIANTLHANGIRVFPNWWRYGSSLEDPGAAEYATDTLFNPSDPAHPLRASTLSALETLLSAASAKGLIVDLTFTRETVSPLMSVQAYGDALVAVAAELRPYRNVLFDLQNEFPSHDLQPDDVGALLRAVNAPAGDPYRIVTASAGYTPEQTGTMAAAQGLWVAAHHDARQSGWSDAATLSAVVTGVKTGAAPTVLPVYLQEPTGWGTGSHDDQTPGHFTAAAVAAKAAGAAAWTFHQRAGFNLQEASFESRLAGDATLRTELLGTRAAIDAQVWGLDATDEIHFYHLDALGSVRAVTDQNGTLQARHEYLPFGEEWAPPADPDTRRFTGKERDADTGLDYFGARYYRADLGRFTTVDPEMTLDENLVDPQRWNRYAYARNNPLKYVDPDGRNPMAVVWLAQLAQRIANSPMAQRAATWAQAQGVAAWNWGTRFFNSPAGQETVQTIAELATGAQAPSAAGTFGFSRVEGVLEGFTYGRLPNGAEVAARFSTAGQTLTASILGAFNAEGPKSAGTLSAILQGSQALAKQEGASQLIVQAVGVVNPRLAEVLLKQGFKQTTVKVGKETITAFEKIYEVK